MEPARAIELLGAQITEAERALSTPEGLRPDFGLTEWRNRSESILRRSLGADHFLVKRFVDVQYSLMVATSATPRSSWDAAKRRGVVEAAGILKTGRLELHEAEVDRVDSPTEAGPAPSELDGVFLVHGHDGRREVVARVLGLLTGEQPTILHELPNQGRTIIEKFEQHAGDKAFAVILATGDDYGGERGSKASRPRARQNVIFELGFFVGAIGRERVAVLHDEGVELPSDYQGVVYIPLDSRGGWRLDLAKELRAAGISADTNNL